MPFFCLHCSLCDGWLVKSNLSCIKVNLIERFEHITKFRNDRVARFKEMFENFEIFLQHIRLGSNLSIYSLQMRF